jgi:hypothetical protein
VKLGNREEEEKRENGKSGNREIGKAGKRKAEKIKPTAIDEIGGAEYVWGLRGSRF